MLLLLLLPPPPAAAAAFFLGLSTITACTHTLVLSGTNKIYIVADWLLACSV